MSTTDTAPDHPSLGDYLTTLLSRPDAPGIDAIRERVGVPEAAGIIDGSLLRARWEHVARVVVALGGDQGVAAELWQRQWDDDAPAGQAADLAADYAEQWADTAQAGDDAPAPPGTEELLAVISAQLTEIIALLRERTAEDRHARAARR